MRPQSVIFTLLAEQLLDRDLPAVSAGSIIEVLERTGVTEHATRATLARMHKRELLDKTRQGRRTYYQMTPRCVSILEDGRERIWLRGAVNREPSAHWTLVTFSLPEAWQRKRYDLRVRLSWAGFGSLQNGVWIAPALTDAQSILEQLGLLEHACVFRAENLHPDDPRKLVRSAFDLAGIARGYHEFIDSWRPALDQPQPDALVLTLRLSTQWLGTIRHDPRVPLHLLPSDWPAEAAEQLFRALPEKHRVAARELAGEILEHPDGA
jgi:phenylacetic acid degradation operon negative regulatory protein